MRWRDGAALPLLGDDAPRGRGPGALGAAAAGQGGCGREERGGGHGRAVARLLRARGRQARRARLRRPAFREADGAEDAAGAEDILLLLIEGAFAH